MAKALEGIRVLDLTRMYGGPMCTMLLAELGAEVIKVEIPESGDGVRNLAPQTEGQESYPFVGRHNAEVYSSLLGYDDEKIDRLQREKVI